MGKHRRVQRQYGPEPGLEKNRLGVSLEPDTDADTDAEQVDIGEVLPLFQQAARQGGISWTAIKQQVLGQNPLLVNDNGESKLMCPHCHTVQDFDAYKVMDTDTDYGPWLAPIRKCATCSHLFAVVL